MITVQEALSQGTQAITQHKLSATPLLDASLLLCKSTGLRREELYSRSQRTIPLATYASYTALIEQRCGGEPVAYLLGRGSFMGEA